MVIQDWYVQIALLFCVERETSHENESNSPATSKFSSFQVKKVDLNCVLYGSHWSEFCCLA